MKLDVMLFRTSGIDDKLLESCSNVLYGVFDEIRVRVVEEFIEIPKSLFDPYRNQYLAEGVAHIALNNTMPEYFTIIIADVDAYVPGFNFVFGLAIPTIKSAAVFTHRLKLGTDYDNYARRIHKEVLHELGHLLGLSHCTRPRCVMRFSNTVLDVDSKEILFCFRCASKLGRCGYKVRLFMK